MSDCNLFKHVVVMKHTFLFLFLKATLALTPIPCGVLSHPMLLLGEVHPKFGRSCSEDRPSQKWGGYELNDMRHHHLLLWCLAQFCYKFYPVNSFMLLQTSIFRDPIENKSWSGQPFPKSTVLHT